MPKPSKFCETCRKHSTCKEVCKELNKHLIYERFKSREVEDEELIEYFLYALTVANISKARIIKIIKILAKYTNDGLYKKLRNIKNKGKKLVDVFLPKKQEFKEISTDPQKMDKSRWYQG